MNVSLYQHPLPPLPSLPQKPPHTTPARTKPTSLISPSKCQSPLGTFLLLGTLSFGKFRQFCSLSSKSATMDSWNTCHEEVRLAAGSHSPSCTDCWLPRHGCATTPGHTDHTQHSPSPGLLLLSPRKCTPREQQPSFPLSPGTCTASVSTQLWLPQPAGSAQ